MKITGIAGLCLVGLISSVVYAVDGPVLAITPMIMPFATLLFIDRYRNK